MFRVQVFNLPVGCFTGAVGERLENFIGRFIQYDESNKGAVWKNYMRIRVEIDVLFPLKRWKNIRMGNGLTARAEFKYEKLNLFCFVCGKLDHIESRCDELYNSINEEVVKGWGPWLKAGDRRGVPMQGERWLKLKDNDEQSTRDSPNNTNQNTQNQGVATTQAHMRGTDFGVTWDLTIEGRDLVLIGATKTVSYNPIYGSSQTDSEDGMDANPLEIKKRKRQMALHGDTHNTSVADNTIVDPNTTVVPKNLHF
ncbi:hypothetical protein ACS0TY_011921 [Phlomoides rotata]